MWINVAQGTSASFAGDYKGGRTCEEFLEFPGKSEFWYLPIKDVVEVKLSSATLDWLYWVTQTPHWCAALLSKSNFFLISPAGMQRWNNCFIITLLLHLRSSPRFFCFFLSGAFLNPRNKYITCSESTLDCRSWLFYFMLTHFWNVMIEMPGYLVEPPVSSSLVPAECLHHLMERLRKDVYTQPVYIGRLFFLKGFFFPACTKVLGRQVSYVSFSGGVWKVPDLTPLNPTEGCTQDGERDAKFKL